MDLKDLQIPPFCIALNYRGRLYQLTVRQVRLDGTIEHFEVTGKFTAKLIQSMRPYFRMNDSNTDKYNIGAAPGTVVRDKEALDLIIAEIKFVIAGFENKTFFL